MKARRLLYVDDSTELAHLVKTFFKLRFPIYEVSTATSVDDALDHLRTRPDADELPDAIVADVNIARREDGVTLVQAVRAEFPRMRTVLVTGSPRRAADVPAHAFVLKDGNAMQFVDRIFDLIQC